MAHRRHGLSAVALFTVTAIVAACVQTQTQTPSSSTNTSTNTASAAPAAPSELVIAMNGDPSTLDTQQGFSPLDGTFGHNLFDSLVGTDPATGKLVPALAQSWDFASDSMSVTLHLRPNVKFHDGTPFNAAAVKFNYDRELDPTNEFNKIGTWKLQAQFAGNIKVPIQVVDDTTVIMNFKNLIPRDLNLAYLTLAPAEMESPTAIQAGRDNYPSHPIGTGAYQFVSWDKGQRLVLGKNANYWGPKPQYDRIVLIPITDADARLAAFRAGTTDVNMDISGDQFAAIQNDSKFAAYTSVGTHIWHIMLNEKTVPALKDKRVRMAFNYAVNKDSIVKDVLGGNGVAAKCFMSSAYGEWVNTSLPGFPYDPAKAKQLLADAGYPNGQGIPQMVLNIPSDTPGKPVQVSEAIQSDLAAIGVKVTLAPSDFSAWIGKVGKGDFQLAAFSLFISLTDPDNALHGYVKDGEPPSFHNFAYYENSQIETLFAQQRTVTDHAQRVSIVQQMQQILCADDPAELWVYHAVSAVVANKSKVKKITPTNDAALIFNLIDKP